MADRRRQLGEDWTQQEVVDFVEACFDRDAILDLLLGYSSRWFGPRMILIAGRGALQPYRVEGWDGLNGGGDLRKLRASVSADAELLVESSTRGSADTLGLTSLFEKLDQEPPAQLTSVGVRISGRTAIVLLGVPDHDDPLAPLEAIADQAGEQLEILIKRAKRDELPPEDERIPPLPERLREEADDEAGDQGSEEFEATNARGAGSPPGWEEPPSGRHTMRMDVPVANPDAADDDESHDDDEAQPPGFVENSSPRITLRSDAFKAVTAGASRATGSSDDADDRGEGADRSGPGETMFGAIPFASERDEEGEEQEEEASPSGSTMFGLGVADLGPSDGDAKQEPDDGEAEGDEERREDVAVYAPRQVGDEASASKRTLVGGIAAESGLVSEMQRGGEGDEAPEAAAEPAAEAAAEPAAEAESLPGAFILKRTIIGRRSSEGSGSPEPSAPTIQQQAPAAAVLVEPSEASEPDDVPAETSTTIQASGDLSMPAGTADEVSSVGGERSEGHSTQLGLAENFVPSEVLHRAAAEAEAEAEAAAEAEAKPQSEAREAEDAPDAEDAPEAKDAPEIEEPHPDSVEPSIAADGGEQSEAAGIAAEKSGDIDDEWLDYFAVEERLFDALDDLPDGAPESEGADGDLDDDGSEAVEHERIALNAGHDDPLTIPPEAMERLLDSGPHAIDLQEHFLALDSRDRDAAFAAAEEVVRNKTQALPVLESMFPGRLFVDRYQYTPETLPPVDEHGPVLAAIVRIGDDALEVVGNSLDARSLESRFYATFLLTRLSAGSLLHKLYPRLFDRDQQTRSVALNIAHRYQDHPDFEAAMLAPMRHELEGDEELHVEVAASFLGRLRDTAAIAPLIEALGKHEGRSNHALLQALQKVGLQSHRSPYEWRQWWEHAHDEPRSKWLVAALDSAADEIRMLAFDEVQRLPGLELNYHPHQPRKLRTRAQQELEAWFASR